MLPDINQNNIKTTWKNYKMLKQIFLFFLCMCEQYRMNSTAGRKPGILIPNLYFYDVKYRLILRKIDKNKCWKKIVKILKNKIKKIEMGQPGPFQWAGPTRPKTKCAGYCA